jgi:uncharacterized protein
MAGNEGPHEVLVDCDEGRRLGCRTFCCCLLVRLAPDERGQGLAGEMSERFVEKNEETGYCIHMDPETGRCTIWKNRPAVCRHYDCNRDPLLQKVLREGLSSLVQLVTSPDLPPGTPRVRVPQPKRPGRRSS